MKEEIWNTYIWIRIYVEYVVIYMNEMSESWGHKSKMTYESWLNVCTMQRSML